jgi:hypothetical protein
MFSIKQIVDFMLYFNYINQKHYFNKKDFTGGKYGKN